LEFDGKSVQAGQKRHAAQRQHFRGGPRMKAAQIRSSWDGSDRSTELPPTNPVNLELPGDRIAPPLGSSLLTLR
jgi:hypothetical protein